MIEITVSRVMDRGEKSVLIKAINGVKEKKELPLQYLRGQNNFYSDNRENTKYITSTRPIGLLFETRKIYSKSDFEERIELLKNAAYILSRINDEIKYQAKSWVKSEVIYSI